MVDINVRWVGFWTKDPNPSGTGRVGSGAEDTSDCPTVLVAKATFFLDILPFFTFRVLFIGDTLKPWGPWHFLDERRVGIFALNGKIITFMNKNYCSLIVLHKFYDNVTYFLC